jgi:23S rRNA (guanosine2251-2'-O)-methyltransferase
VRAADARGTRPALQRIVGVHPVLEALRARRRPLHGLYLRRGSRELGPLREAARQAGLEVRELEPAELARLLPPGVRDQGVVLEAGPLPEATLAELAATRRTLVALDGVEDPQNLGALIRVAEAAGAAGLVLTERRAPELSAAVAKASAGAVEWLPVARVVNLNRALKYLKNEGFWIYGGVAGGGLDALRADPAGLPAPRVLVLGGEGQGLRRSVREALDFALSIPMAGQVASLNVAAAGAVLLFELARWEILARSR